MNQQIPTPAADTEREFVAGQSPPAASQTNSGRNFFRRFQDDFRSGKRYVVALRKAKQLRDRKQVAEQRLLGTLEDIGAKAVELGVGEDIAGFQESQALRASLAGAERTLADRSAARKQAEDGVAEETQRHSKAISSLEAEQRLLVQAAVAAGQAVASVRREIAVLESRIRATEAAISSPAQAQSTTASPQELQQKLATLQQSRAAAEEKLPPLQEKADQAKAAADEKASEVAEARQAWSQVKTRCDGELASARSAEAEAAKTVKSSRLSLSAALQPLGKAILDAGIRSPQLDSALSQAHLQEGEIADAANQLSDLQEEMAASKGGAKRAAIAAGVGLIAILAVVLSLVPTPSGSGGRGHWWSAHNAGNIPLHSVDVPDQIDGRRAFTMLVPAGWKADADITYRDRPGAPANILIRVGSPDGKEEFSFATVAAVVSGHWSGLPDFRGNLGADYVMPPPNSAKECLMGLVLPLLRPGLGNVQQIGSEDYPEASREFTAEAHQRRIGAHARVARVRVEYQDPQTGQMVEEDVAGTLWVSDPGNPVTIWGMDRVFAWRAPKGALGQYADLFSQVADSVQPDKEWMQRYAAATASQSASAAGGSRTAMELSAIAAKRGRDIAKIINDTNTYHNEVRDSTFQKWDDVATGTERYKTDGGDVVRVPDGPGVVWSCGPNPNDFQRFRYGQDPNTMPGMNGKRWTQPPHAP
jgi:hypothetical protein